MEASLEGTVQTVVLREGLVVCGHLHPYRYPSLCSSEHRLIGGSQRRDEIEQSWRGIGMLLPATMIGGVSRRSQPYGFSLPPPVVTHPEPLGMSLGSLRPCCRSRLCGGTQLDRRNGTGKRRAMAGAGTDVLTKAYRRASTRLICGIIITEMSNGISEYVVIEGPEDS